MLSQALAACGRTHRLKASRKRPCPAGFAQCQHLIASQKGFHRPAYPGPEFNLTGNRALSRFTHEAGIEDQSIRDFHRLTHTATVAKCYLAVKEQPQPQTRTSINARLAESQLERSLPPNPQAE